ncbi:hypothetical protein GCM10023094_25070 [Rhodococcus olei]|uniref:Uncharacterized protein n=1 Tax=Rhodococcus olei TaxID=2161675 RepID=A0ABP8P0Y9_9NOCA
MTGLLPVGVDLASVAVNMLSGKAAKAAPELLGRQANTVATSISAQAETLDLPKLSTSLTKLSQSQGAEDLVLLVGEGLSAGHFFAPARTPTTTASSSTMPAATPFSGFRTG